MWNEFKVVFSITKVKNVLRFSELLTKLFRQIFCQLHNKTVGTSFLPGKHFHICLCLN